MFSTSSPTYPASVRLVASAMVNVYLKSGKGLCQQRLSAACGFDKQDIAFLDFHLSCVDRRVKPLVMVIKFYSENFFADSCSIT